MSRMSDIDATVRLIAQEHFLDPHWTIINALKDAWLDGFKEGQLSDPHDKVKP